MQSDLYHACSEKIKNGELGLEVPTWGELAQLWDIPSGKILKDRYYRAKSKEFKNDKNPKSPKELQNEDEERQLSLKIEEDGSQVSDRLILISENDSKNPDFLLNAHGYDPEYWVLVNAISNFWNGMRPKDMGLATLRQSKITVRPKTEGDFSFGDIGQLIFAVLLFCSP